MTTFDPCAYGPAIAALLRDAPLSPLGPGRPDAARRPSLAALGDDAFLPRRVSDPHMAAACRAALWLRYDFLDESHAISQGLLGAEGSYWHGILHRREPDPSNAAYWLRRVGEHPIYERLAKEVAILGLRLDSSRWDPFGFIDQCEEHRGQGTDQERLLRQVQQWEWELLFDWCFRWAAKE